jgi:iron(III) transport system permease protein
MTRLLAGLARALAVAVVAWAVLAPVGAMVYASLRVEEVRLVDGRVVEAAGRVEETPEGYRLHLPPGEEDQPTDAVRLPRASVAEVRTKWSLAHYRSVVESPRTPGLLGNSLRVAGGAVLAALLLGLPVGWLLARTALPGRRVVAVLCAGPLLLPPFFAAMGVSTSIGALLARLGLRGGDLQVASSIACFGALLFPVVALLTGRAMAAVPAGLVEAARLQGGRGAALRRVVLPAVLPAAACASAIVFVLALSDFAVPDLLGVFLPTDAVPIHVFATEVFLQWSRYGNAARAVATGVPFVALTLVFLLAAAAFARRAPAAFLGGAYRPRPPIAMTPLRAALGYVLAGGALYVGLVLPIQSVCAWGFSPAHVPARFEETPRVVEDTLRWLRIGIASAALATFTATVLARWALRGGAAVRAFVLVAAALPLAVPAMTLGAGVEHLRIEVPALAQRFLTPVLLLTARFLPYALAGAWLALREADPGLEEAARLAGAGPGTRARRIWGPLARRGIVAAALLVLVFALREIDAAVLVEPAVLPVRIYDMVHYGRTAQVADLSMAYLAVVLLPAIAAAVVLGRRRPAPTP